MLCNFLSRAYHYPPCLIRLLARKHPRGEPYTLVELAARSGLAPARVDAISQNTDWRGIDLYEMEAFSRACDCDLFSRSQMKRLANYLQGSSVNGKRIPPSFSFLKRSPEWESTYKPLLIRYRQSLKQNQQ